MGPVATLEKKESASVEKLRRWLGDGFAVDDDGTSLVIKATGSQSIVLSPDGQFLAFENKDGAVAVVNPKSGPRWTMSPWLKSWHSNVGGAPGLMMFEFPSSGEAILVHCLAEHGLIAVNSQRLVDRATGRVRAETPAHTQDRWSHAFSPDGTKLAVAFAPDPNQLLVVLQIFDTSTGRRTDSGMKGPLAWNAASELVGSATPCGDGE